MLLKKEEGDRKEKGPGTSLGTGEQYTILGGFFFKP